MGTDPAEGRVFTSVISGLQKTYPKDKMDEISTSFCFICLLHLANERGLKLETEDNRGGNFEQAERMVGRIWDLKVRLCQCLRLGIHLLIDFMSHHRYIEIRTQPPQRSISC